MGETAVISVPQGAPPFAFGRRRSGAARRLVRRSGAALRRGGKAMRRSFARLRSRGKGIRSFRARGGGKMRIGRVVLFTVLGAVGYAVVDQLLARAGLDSALARALIGAGVGVAMIVFGGSALTQVGAGMIISAAGHVLNDEVRLISAGQTAPTA